MVVAETLAVIEGIGLVTKSVQQIKSVLRNKDSQPDELAAHIDNLFKAENQIASKSRNPAKNGTRCFAKSWVTMQIQPRCKLWYLTRYNNARLMRR